MADAKLLDGRSWSVEKRGITSVTRRYLIERDSVPTGVDTEEIATATGLPAIGSAHSSDDNLVVTGYDFAEQSAESKKYLVAIVKYSATSQELSTGETPEAVESWGWHSGSVGRDLTHDAVTGTQVLNTYGDPFDSVPQVDRPSPMFTKVIKTKTRKSGWQSYVDKLNDAEITIGGLACEINTIRVVQVDEERLIGDAYGFKYRYTIGLQYLSNKVKIGGASTATEIGWDVAVVNQGTRGYTQDSDGNWNPGRFTDVDPTTGETVPVSLPVLMDGDSHRLTGTNPTPYMIRIAAYERATIPSEFYSEPS